MKNTPAIDFEILDRIQKLLEKKPRDMLLFFFLTQTNLPILSILDYRVRDLRDLQPGDPFPLQGHRHARRNEMLVSRDILSAFQMVLQQNEPNDEDYLFLSRRTTKPLNKSSVSNMVKDWYRSVNAPQAASTKSLRPRELARTMGTKSGNWPAETNTEKATLDQVKCITYSQTVYQHLLKAIVSGKIPPGESLTVNALAEQMGVGQMPVREALIKLETDGYLITQRAKGRIVKTLSVNDLNEILTLRLNLENLAAEIAISKCPESTIRRLEKIHHRYLAAREKRDVVKHRKHNRDFHFTLYEAADMPILLSVITDLWNKVTPYFNLLYFNNQFYQARGDVHIHDMLMNGITERSAPEVRKWLTFDLTEGAEFVIGKLSGRTERNAR